MLRVQAMLLLAFAGLPAADTGQAGLQALAEQRAQVRAVEGTGMRTVQRIGEDDEPLEKRRVRFAVAADGRYEIVITAPDDPDERTRFVCDGSVSASQEWSMPDEPPVVKRQAADAQDLLRRLLACVRLDLVQLSAEYAIDLQAAGPGRRVLRLVPTAAAVAREVAVVSVHIDDAGRPLLIVLDDTSGERHRLEVASFRDDPDFDPARFAVP